MTCVSSVRGWSLYPTCHAWSGKCTADGCELLSLSYSHIVSGWDVRRR